MYRFNIQKMVHRTHRAHSYSYSSSQPQANNTQIIKFILCFRLRFQKQLEVCLLGKKKNLNLKNGIIIDVNRLIMIGYIYFLLSFYSIQYHTFYIFLNPMFELGIVTVRPILVRTSLLGQVPVRIVISSCIMISLWIFQSC